MLSKITVYEKQRPIHQKLGPSPSAIRSSSRNLLVKDRYGAPLFLFENAFAERWFADKYPDVKLTSKL
ncbi:hypothetical protein WP50_13170 [Lactiplantibacillus plantarum]|nr:hypothetical protein WP50_13165 [Lactiplantibacillus plantarum]KLD60081.1 hypothetical protein WP50_13170 [Lactiplantibacillus plantarum]